MGNTASNEIEGETDDVVEEVEDRVLIDEIGSGIEIEDETGDRIGLEDEVGGKITIGKDEGRI